MKWEGLRRRVFQLLLANDETSMKWDLQFWSKLVVSTCINRTAGCSFFSRTPLLKSQEKAKAKKDPFTCHKELATTVSWRNIWLHRPLWRMTGLAALVLWVQRCVFVKDTSWWKSQLSLGEWNLNRYEQIIHTFNIHCSPNKVLYKNALELPY